MFEFFFKNRLNVVDLVSIALMTQYLLVANFWAAIAVWLIGSFISGAGEMHLNKTVEPKTE